LDKTVINKLLFQFIFLLLILFSQIAFADECLDDKLTRVKGVDNCLAITTFRDSSVPNPAALVIFIHGDQSDMKAVTSMPRLAENIQLPSDVVKVFILRPGYFDAQGNESTGNNSGRRDSYTSDNVDEVTKAIQSLQKYYRVKNTVLVGHSGGAAYAGVMIGRTPGIASGALLLSCPCDISSWRSDLQARPWGSLSPINFYKTVPITTKVIAMTGDSDNNTREYLSKEYVAALTARDVDARYITAQSAGHNDTLNVELITQPIKSLLKANN
jgi:poly(3-hydroxybutyrate) depolymerase